jgi:hypothetical protein
MTTIKITRATLREAREAFEADLLAWQARGRDFASVRAEHSPGGVTISAVLVDTAREAS